MYYYLTSSIHAINNIALNRIKISRFNNVNDPFELLSVNLKNIDERKYFRKIKNDINKEFGFISFSNKWENPVMWGHYADNHKGIALGFDIKNNNLTEVDYIDNLNKYDKSNMSPIEMESMKTSLKNSKFSQWEYENESRLTLQLNECDNEGDLYFYSLDKINLKEIIVGANCQIDLKIIKKLIDNIRPKDNINIIKARIAFTEFKITKDKIKTKNGLK